VADPGHDAEVIDAFAFKTRLGAHAPSLPIRRKGKALPDAGLLK
jgi:hypothetical protein